MTNVVTHCMFLVTLKNYKQNFNLGIICFRILINLMDPETQSIVLLH